MIHHDMFFIYALATFIHGTLRFTKICFSSLGISFPSRMPSRSLILMKAFWFCGRFSEAMSFSRFALLFQKSQFMYQIFSIVWLPRVNCQLLLCRAKPAWIVKRSIHYVSLRHYNPGELLKEIPPYFKSYFWHKRSKFWKLHCLRKMALESKRLHQNH